MHNACKNGHFLAGYFQGDQKYHMCTPKLILMNSNPSQLNTTGLHFKINISFCPWTILVFIYSVISKLMVFDILTLLCEILYHPIKTTLYFTSLKKAKAFY